MIAAGQISHFHFREASIAAANSESNNISNVTLHLIAWEFARVAWLGEEKQAAQNICWLGWCDEPRCEDHHPHERNDSERTAR